MALIENFDVDFEDYIIFHRGIAEVSVKDDNHLHVIHQDGYDQDLGDPYGNPAREGAAAAEEAKNAAVDARDAAQSAAQTANGYRIQASDSASAAQRALNDAVVAKNAAEAARNTAVQAKDEAIGIRDSITASAQEIKTASDLAIAASETVVETSEAWAVGQRNGEDVEETDPTYNNNSKYYAGLAEASRLNASLSAESAASDSSIASQAAQQTSQDLADVRAVADDIIRPLEKLNDITYDSENDSYNINPISNETIDSFFAEYLPLGAEIVSQPVNVILEDGVPITFAVEASHVKAYQWQYRDPKVQVIIWNNITSEPIETATGVTAEGYDTNTLTLSDSGFAYPYEFRCAITGENNETTYTDIVFMIKQIEIVTQLTSVAAEIGEEAVLRFAAKGPVAYQWQSRHFAEDEWTNLDRYEVASTALTATSRYFESVSESDYTTVYRCIAIRRDGKETISNEAYIYSQTAMSQPVLALYEQELNLERNRLASLNSYIHELEEQLEMFEQGSEAWETARNMLWQYREDVAVTEAHIAELEELISQYGQEGGE